MIGLDSAFLASVASKHVSNISKVTIDKIEVLKLCLKYIATFNKVSKEEFKKELARLSVSNVDVIVPTVNWFLKSDIRAINGKKGVVRKIRSANKPDLFFVEKNRVFPSSPRVVNALQDHLNYFDEITLENILGGTPKELITASIKFKSKFPETSYSKQVNKVIRGLIDYLFDYEAFSKKESIYANKWGGYDLARALDVRACLYCNRNYIVTVMNGNDKIIRPEFDHFFPKSIYPLLSLSFYNLIPSCHVCNSNLKGKENFNLDDYFHPYLNDFDNLKVYFSYRPKNPKAFFRADQNLNIILNTSELNVLAKQVNSNIDLFRLSHIYNNHLDVVEGLLDIQRKTHEERIEDMFRNVFKDSTGKALNVGKEEIYELIIRNYHSSVDFYKKPMSKFERDIAKEIGLI